VGVARDDMYIRLIDAGAHRGGVGVIPTDTMYALVCDINNAKAVDALYRWVACFSHAPLLRH
jgi:tRNA A37 threonylcarbamoyladenosine synthetase subunit TsaC/SUA5/YrdC